MVATRNNCEEAFILDQDPSNVPPAVRKLQSGGSGSRQTSGLAELRAREVMSNSKWNFTSPTGNYSLRPLLQNPGIYCSECSDSAATTPHETPNDTASDQNVIINASNL